MITAVDTSVLLDVLLNDPKNAERSKLALRTAAREEAIMVCESCLAEIIPVLSADELVEFFSDSNLRFLPSSRKAQFWREKCFGLI